MDREALIQGLQRGGPSADCEARPRARDVIADQAAGPGDNLVTDQAPGARTDLLLEPSEIRRCNLEYCESPRAMAEHMEHMNLSHPTHFRRRRLHPPLRSQLIRLRHSDAPGHPQQGYVVTDTALALLTQWSRKGEA